MSLQTISLFLDRFKHLLVSEVAVREVVREIIQKEMNISLDVKNIKFKNATVHITASPLLKNELYMKKTLIMEQIEKSLARKISDLR